MDEDPSLTVDEYLDRLCWLIATEGERFYPPKETAQECMDAVEDVYDRNDDMDYEEGLAWEEGQHSRAWLSAVERFKDMEGYGFDPVARAKRSRRRVEEEQDVELSKVDWEWWEVGR